VGAASDQRVRPKAANGDLSLFLLIGGVVI